MEGKIRLMSHLVAGYPTEEFSLAAAEALVRGGAAILEVQLPFSDPSADGPAIQEACTRVLERGFRTADGMRFIARLREKFPQIPIYIMSYASLAYTPGVENFCRMASEAGVSGLIIPDLPFDCDEGLTKACAKFGMENIPVAAPSMSTERLQALSRAGFEHIYATLRVGITGTDTTISDATLEFLAKVGSGGSKVYGGFGISSGSQARILAPSVDAIVAGSVFVRAISANSGDIGAMSAAVEAKARELSLGTEG